MSQEQLNRVAAQLGANYIQLGLYENSAESKVFKCMDRGAEEFAPSGHPVLCSIKLFTATIMRVLAQTQQLSLSKTLAEIVPSMTTVPVASASNIQIAQLLAHTHGLADTLFECRDSTGSIPGLFHPGSFYSYGSTGYVLLGRIIEAVTGQRFEEVLYRLLLEHIGCDESKRGFVNTILRRGEPRICPAAGTGLSLALEDLLAFCRIFTDRDCKIRGLSPSVVQDILQPRASMPGWSPYIKASCYGFRDFGNGWFGHNGIDQRYLTYLRVSPSRKAAICLVANGVKDNIGMLPAVLLKDNFPELFVTLDSQPKVDVGKVLTAQHPLFGTYTDFLYQYKILISAGRLTLEIIEGTGDGHSRTIHTCFLYPAEEEVYFLSKPWRKVVCIQLIKESGMNCYYLWNFDQVMPMLEQACP